MTRTVMFVSGSTRHGSVSGAVLATAATVLPHTWRSVTYDGMGRLPHFNPDVEAAGPPPIVDDLRTTIQQADAVLFSTPEYGGAMPGALKNLLEWTIGATVMSDRPVGWINPSTAPAQAAETYRSLRTVLSYTGARLIEQACVDIPVSRAHISAAGVIEDGAIRGHIAAAVGALTGPTGRGR